MVEFAPWLTEVATAPCDPIVTRHHARRGGLAGVH